MKSIRFMVVVMSITMINLKGAVGEAASAVSKLATEAGKPFLENVQQGFRKVFRGDGSLMEGVQQRTNQMAGEGYVKKVAENNLKNYAEEVNGNAVAEVPVPSFFGRLKDGASRFVKNNETGLVTAGLTGAGLGAGMMIEGMANSDGARRDADNLVVTDMDAGDYGFMSHNQSVRNANEDLMAERKALESEKSYLTSEEYGAKKAALEARQSALDDEMIGWVPDSRQESRRLMGQSSDLGYFHDYAGVYANRLGRGLGNMLSYASMPFVYLWRGFINLPVINKMHFLTDAMRDMTTTAGAIPAATMKKFKEAYKALLLKVKKSPKEEGKRYMDLDQQAAAIA